MNFTVTQCAAVNSFNCNDVRFIVPRIVIATQSSLNAHLRPFVDYVMKFPAKNLSVSFGTLKIHSLLLRDL